MGFVEDDSDSEIDDPLIFREFESEVYDIDDTEIRQMIRQALRHARNGEYVLQMLTVVAPIGVAHSVSPPRKPIPGRFTWSNQLIVFSKRCRQFRHACYLPARKTPQLCQWKIWWRLTSC